jgi:hypothetical protein
MSRTREEIVAERKRQKEEYGELFDEVAALLFRHDPVGINFEDNADEYESEVGTILPRLRGCQSADDVRRVVHQEFVRWFDADTAGPEEHYAKISTEIWERWQKFGAV